MVHPIELMFFKNYIHYCVIYIVDFGEYRTNGIFTAVKKNNYYTFQPIEVNRANRG